MLKVFKIHWWLKPIVFIVVLNILLYSFILLFNNLVPFNQNDYEYSAYHFIADDRYLGKPFQLFSALAQYDAQWYLKIAREGYPFQSNMDPIPTGTPMVQERLAFAFFPLYPLLLSGINLLFNNILLSAFIFSNFISLISAVSLYWVIKKWYGDQIAFKTLALVFCFPFSIFLRSYFSETLKLLFLIWTVYFMVEKKFIHLSLILAFFNVLHGTAMFLGLPGLYLLLKKRHFRLSGIFSFIYIIPFIGWMVFNFIKTGDPLFFIHSLNQWFSFPVPVIYNLYLISQFFFLPFHRFHYSQIDILMVLITGFLLIKSQKWQKPELWWLTLSIWIVPLLTKDLMSFSRYVALLFPIFVYLAYKLKPKAYYALLSFSVICLFWVSLYFVNWYWIG